MFHAEHARIMSVVVPNLLSLPRRHMLPRWWGVFRVVTGTLTDYWALCKNASLDAVVTVHACTACAAQDPAAAPPPALVPKASSACHPLALKKGDACPLLSGQALVPSVGWCRRVDRAVCVYEGEYLVALDSPEPRMC